MAPRQNAPACPAIDAPNKGESCGALKPVLPPPPSWETFKRQQERRESRRKLTEPREPGVPESAGREVNLGEQQEVTIRRCNVLNCLRDTSGTQEQEEELGTDG